MKIQPGEGKDGQDIVIMAKREAVAMIVAITEALASGEWGGDKLFRVLIEFGD